MFVRDYMTKHPVMVEAAMPIVEAQAIMAETQSRYVPVIETGKRLVGLVTHEQLRIPPADLASLDVWEISRHLSNLTVKDVMVKKKDIISIGSDATLEQAANLMANHQIGCLPVLEEGIVVGIITKVDMFVQLAALLGGRVHGVRAMIRMPDRMGEFAKITKAIAARGWGIYTSGGVPTPKRPGYWDVVIKLRGVSPDEVKSVLEQIQDQEVIDVREI
jgi:acetoin utilization protein AcuB